MVDPEHETFGMNLCGIGYYHIITVQNYHNWIITLKFRTLIKNISDLLKEIKVFVICSGAQSIATNVKLSASVPLITKRTEQGI